MENYLNRMGKLHHQCDRSCPAARAFVETQVSQPKVNIVCLIPRNGFIDEYWKHIWETVVLFWHQASNRLAGIASKRYIV
jgi:hypothetical protein